MTVLVSAPGSFLRSRRAWRRFLREIMATHPDIIVGTEAKRRHLRALVPRTRWVVRQRWNTRLDREARAGGFAIWRRSLTPRGQFEPRQAQRLGSRMSLWPSPVLNRYIGHADLPVGGRVRRVFWVHFPLKSTGRQSQYLASLLEEIGKAQAQGLEWLVGGDYNMPPTEVAALLNGEAHGVPNGITGWITGPGVKVAHERTLPPIKGFDHRPHMITVTN